MKQLLLFTVYYVAPMAAFILIAFVDGMRGVGLALFAALFAFHLIRGKDYNGNPTAFGIRKDGRFVRSLFGKQTRADRDPKS